MKFWDVLPILVIIEMGSAQKIIKKIIKKMTAIKQKSDVKMNPFLAQATQALQKEDFSLAYDEIQR
jgi:hypothetical protein